MMREFLKHSAMISSQEIESARNGPMAQKYKQKAAASLISADELKLVKQLAKDALPAVRTKAKDMTEAELVQRIASILATRPQQHRALILAALQSRYGTEAKPSVQK